MFRSLFKSDSALMSVVTRITDYIVLSLCWILSCIPVVTAGAAFAALYDASFRAFRQGEKKPWQRFWDVFRANWKTGILPTVVVLVVFVVVFLGTFLFWSGALAQEIPMLLFLGSLFLAVLVLGILSLVFPILSRFENGFLEILKNSFLLGLANLPRTLALGILNGVTVLLCTRFVYLLFFLPALCALLGSLLIEKMFEPFMEEEEAAR